MDVFAFALKMELDGEKYYREQAEKVKYNDLKVVLEGLADDERRHYKIIQSMQSQTYNYVEDDPSLSKARKIFKSYQKDVSALKNKASIEKLKDEQIDVYRMALLKEQESVELYKKLNADANNSKEKEILERLMNEEKGHVEVIDSIIEMLNHVNDWVEAAEFNNPDTY